jgi:hypothetical protein
MKIKFPGAFYHAASSGNERKAVFRSKPDREGKLEIIEVIP